MKTDNKKRIEELEEEIAYVMALSEDSVDHNILSYAIAFSSDEFKTQLINVLNEGKVLDPIEILPDLEFGIKRLFFPITNNSGINLFRKGFLAIINIQTGSVESVLDQYYAELSNVSLKDLPFVMTAPSYSEQLANESINPGVSNAEKEFYQSNNLHMMLIRRPPEALPAPNPGGGGNGPYTNTNYPTTTFSGIKYRQDDTRADVNVDERKMDVL